MAASSGGLLVAPTASYRLAILWPGRLGQGFDGTIGLPGPSIASRSVLYTDMPAGFISQTDRSTCHRKLPTWRGGSSRLLGPRGNRTFAIS